MLFRTMVRVAVAAALLAATATPAQATESPEPWQPYRATDFVSPAGRSCDFDLAVSAVEDEEEYRVASRHPDGETMRSFTGVGPFGFGFRATDTYPRGYYRFDGLHRITLDPDGTRHLPVAAGTAENICVVLG